MNSHTIILTHQEAIDLTEAGTTIEGESGRWRWGSTQEYIIPRDGKHYAYMLRYHVEDGCQDEGNVTAFEVVAVERIITTWQPVK